MTARTAGIVSLAGYLATIVAANYAVQHYGVVSVGFGLVAPAGVYFAGLALTLRDVVQRELGRVVVVSAVVVGAGLSYFVAPSLAFASGAAFLTSELADFAVYTPLERRGWLLAVVCSNVVGAVIDSVVFLWLAFSSLEFLRGQVVGKLWITAATVAVVAAGRAARLRVDAAG